MSETSGMLASAVVLPDEEATDSTLTPTGATKRRQSLSTETDSNKRARTDSEARSDDQRDDAASDALLKPAELGKTTTEDDTGAESSSVSATRDGASGDRTTGPQRRRSGVIGADEERKRGKRLFGSLLGTLSQRPTSTVQKRRDDIEKKQKAKLRMVDEEREEEKRLDRERLDERRRGEMRIWDEKSMRVRHSNMKAMANFLATTAEPVLYYRPWDLLPRQEEKIDAQIEQVGKDIDKELEELGYARQDENSERAGTESHSEEINGGKETTRTVGSNNESKTDITATMADSENKSTDRVSDADERTPQRANDDTAKDAADDNENEEMVVEAGEDPVIY